MPIEPGGKNSDPIDPGGKNPGGTNPNMPTTPVSTDAVPPAGVSGATFGDLNVIVWANPVDADFSGVLILRNTVSIVDTPSAGEEYTVGGDIGGSEVVQSANSSDFGVSAATVNTAYYYKIFAYDASHNYAAGVEIEATRESSDKTIFVNAAASGTGDGTSWSNAYSSLNSALTSSAATNKIVVAKGVYKPTSTISDRSATFQLKSNVKVYGGFDVADTLLSERNWRMNKTILSGDIVGDDTDSNQDGIIENADDIKGDNVYTVVTGAGGDVTLDGFTITAGQSNASNQSGSDIGGGGMFYSVAPNDSNNLKLSNIIFSGNMSIGDGGGMFYHSGIHNNLILSNVIFSGNKSLSLGGGLHIIPGNSILSNVVFSGNISINDGGGMYAVGAAANLTLNNVIFSKNKVTGSGKVGGGFFISNGNSTLINVIMWGNTAGACTTGVSPLGNQNICSRELSGAIKTINISHSLIQGCGVSGPNTWAMGASSCGTDGGNNIDSDPMFADADGVDNVAGTLDDDLSLMMGSPAIDAGSNNNPVYDASSSTPPTNMEFLFGTGALDLAGKARVVKGKSASSGPLIDMGAYEYQPMPPL